MDGFREHAADSAGSTAMQQAKFAGPLSVEDALVLGHTRKQLRSERYERRVYGVRDTHEAATLEDFCRLFAARIRPDAIFSHSTAARLLGIPLPLRLEKSPLIHMSFVAPARAPHATGLKGHSISWEPSQVMELHELRLTTPARTWCDLAPMLPLVHLVAAGDFVIHWRSPLATSLDLNETADSMRSKRGLSSIRRAIPLLSDRAESPPESILRVLLHWAGLPTPRINRNIASSEGDFVGRVDFIFDEFKILIEYQGDYHRTSKDQWRKDMTRRSKLESEGWKVMELNWDDLADPAELASRIRALSTH